MMRLSLILLFLISLLPTVAQDKIRVSCVGNSVTYGMRLPNRETECYPARLQEMLGDRYEVRNFGHSGSTLLSNGHRPYVKTPEFQQALDFKGDLVIIHLGLNDTDPRNWPLHREEFIPDYRQLIDTLRSVNPKARVWICLMTPIFHSHPRFQSGTRDWHGQMQRVIRQIAETTDGVDLIDLYTPLHKHPEMFPDALHPDADGAMVLAQTVYSAITGDYGGLTLPVLYGDGMVLQRDEPIMLHGTANAGERVTVMLNGKKQKTVAGTDGQWSVRFPKQKAGGPYTLSFRAQSRSYEFNDVYIGEVWLCSGQSNMEFKVGQSATAQEDLADAANHPLLHLFNMPARARTDAIEWPDSVLKANNRLEHLHYGPWQTCTAQSVSQFSAIAYHMGRILADSLDVHVGIICNAVGGTTTEAWIDRTTIEYEYPQILYNWLDNDHTQAWARGRARLNNKQATNPLQRHPYEPCYMFEAGILPLEQYTIRGVAWYQGESNADKPELHAMLFGLLQRSWRKYFGQRDLPFYFVQLSSINRPDWPTFRDSQRRIALTSRNTWMAVSSDLGDPNDVHPRMKRPIGQRLALQALHHTYKHKIVSEGPVLANAKRVGSSVELTFRNDDGLACTRGFEIAGADGLFYEAEIRIGDGRIVLKSNRVKVPCAVRYAWQPYTEADLHNAQGLPASTFLVNRLK